MVAASGDRYGKNNSWLSELIEISEAMPQNRKRSPIARERIRRVLLLEKDPFQREIIREYLELGGGFKVQLEIPVTGKALEKALKKTNLVLFDVESAQELGKRICRQIKLQSPELPVLGMVDSPPKEYRERKSSFAWDGFIGKPFAPRQLQDRIRSLLGE